MSDYDSPWKEALDRYFESFLALFFPHAHGDIDWRRAYESLDKELQQVVPEAEQGRRLVDKLVKVWRKDGDEEWVLVHVEVQSQRDAEFARRMYVYNYRLFDRYNRRVASVAVLGDDNADWRPDHFGYDLWGCQVGIRFPVVKLLDFAAGWEALEVRPNPFATLVLAHLKTLETRRDPDERRGWKVRLVRGLYERGLGAEDVRQLFRFIDWMMDLPEVHNRLFWREVQRFEEERHMPFVTIAERVGREKGLAEGLEKGRVQGYLAGIEKCLKLKFGDAGLRLMAEIRAVEKEDILCMILDAIETATSPEDLRPIWAARHPGPAADNG